MSDFNMMKKRCEDECFYFLKENMSDFQNETLRNFVETDEMMQAIVEDMMAYIIYSLPLRGILLRAMSAYQRKEGADA